MSRAAQRARMDAYSLRELRLVITPVADVLDETLFPEMARAREHYRNLSAERRAELERDWS